MPMVNDPLGGGLVAKNFITVEEKVWMGELAGAPDTPSFLDGMGWDGMEESGPFKPSYSLNAFPVSPHTHSGPPSWRANPLENPFSNHSSQVTSASPFLETSRLCVTTSQQNPA